MKRIFFVMIVISASLLLGQTGPKISSPAPDYDFGEILEGQVVSHEFEVVNNGKSNLRLEKVRSSCGCTAVQPVQTLLKPGEKTKIKVEFNSENRLGPQTKYVYVFSNDPQTPEYKLTFNAVVVEKIFAPKDKSAKLVLDKNQFDFGNIEEGKVVDVKIGFKNTGQAQLEIIDVKTSCGCTAALLSSKKIAPNQSGNIRIELDTANREGKLTRTVTLFSNDPANPNQTITLFVNIVKRKS